MEIEGGGERAGREVCGEGCGRPRSVCLCGFLPAAPIATATAVVILQHPREARRRLATAPLLRRCLLNLSVVSGRRLRRGSLPLLDSLRSSSAAAALFLFPSDHDDVDQKVADVDIDIADVDKEASNFDRDVPDVDKRFADVYNDLVDVDKDIADVNIEVADVNIHEDLADADMEVAHMDKEVTDVDTHHADVDTVLADVYDALVDVNKDLGDVNIEVGDVDIHKDLTDVDKEVAHMDKILAGVDKEVADVGIDLADVRMKGSPNFRNEVADRDKEVADMDKDFSDVDKNLADEKKVADVDKKVAGMKNLTNMDKKVAGVEKEVADVDSDFVDVGKDVADVDISNYKGACKILIVFDATWKEAREMVRASEPFLRGFARRVSLGQDCGTEGPSMFESELALRKEPYRGCLTTAEAVGRALAKLEPDPGPGPTVEAALLTAVRAMVRFQLQHLAGKTVLPRSRLRPIEPNESSHKQPISSTK